MDHNKIINKYTIQ